MHPSALFNARLFFQTYVGADSRATVMDIGSQDVNGAIKDVVPAQMAYVGVDFISGKNVDVVLDDPYNLPFADESTDIVVSSSCFEHSELFWLLFLEILRVLRPGGLFYLNAPSNGVFHRYPVDCWRFYPDSGHALTTWGKRSGYNPLLLESFTSAKYFGAWNDFVAIFLKDGEYAPSFPNRMIDTAKGYSNGRVHGRDAVLKYSEIQPDQKGITYWFKREYWRRREVKAMENLKLRDR